MSKIFVGMSGWCEADPARTMFQYIGTRDDAEKLIGGEQWLGLSEDDRDDYILENVLVTFKHSLDGEYNDISIEVVEDE